MNGFNLRGRSLVADTDLTREEFQGLLETARDLKLKLRRGEPHAYLAGKTLAMIFQKPSTRTRVAFEVGMAQLGGHALYLGPSDLQLNRGETIEDTARVIGRYADAIMARVFAHGDVAALAAHAGVPVYNGLSDCYHPTQALADLLTITEKLGGLAGCTLAYIGAGNNMLHSLLLAGAITGMHVRAATPIGYAPSAEIVATAKGLARPSGGSVTVGDDPEAAAREADVIYTDVITSMGEDDTDDRRAALRPYQITGALMALARPTAIFMHCLPMHRGEEATAEVADGPQSVIFDQAENRLHVHKALLALTLRG
jgi:ornithine carbamoyltransferase